MTKDLQKDTVDGKRCLELIDQLMKRMEQFRTSAGTPRITVGELLQNDETAIAIVHELKGMVVIGGIYRRRISARTDSEQICTVQALDFDASSEMPKRCVWVTFTTKGVGSLRSFSILGFCETNPVYLGLKPRLSVVAATTKQRDGRPLTPAERFAC